MIPWSIPPAQTQLLVDCGVVGEVCNQAEPSKLSIWSWNPTSILPPKHQKSPISPYWKHSRHTIPWSILPMPTRLLVDCGVGEVWDWAEPLKLAAWLWNATSIPPPLLSVCVPLCLCLSHSSLSVIFCKIIFSWTDLIKCDHKSFKSNKVRLVSSIFCHKI